MAAEKGKLKELERISSPVRQSLMAKAAGKRPLEKLAEQIRIEEERDRRIKAEKVYYGHREAKRKIKSAKEAGRIFDRSLKRWVVPAGGGEANRAWVRPQERTDAPPRMITHPSWAAEYMKYEDKWIFVWYICRGVGASFEDETIAWHDRMEKENPNLCQKLIDEGDEWYNVDFVAPAYSTIPIKIADDGSIDKEWIRSTINFGVNQMKLTDPKEIAELRTRIFDWMQLPEKDRWTY